MWDGCPSCHGDASLPVSLCVVSLLSCFACWTCVKCRINKCLRHIWNFKYNLLVHWWWLSLLGNRVHGSSPSPDMEGALAAGGGTEPRGAQPPQMDEAAKKLQKQQVDI